MISLITFAVLAITIFCLYQLSKRHFDYWEKRNIPYPKPLPLIGNYGPYILLKEYIGTVAQRICLQYPTAPYIGVFYGTTPTLIVQDTELLKLILTKDFYYFNSRENSKYSDKETFLRSLFFTNGDSWKVMRQHMAPIFSSSKLKVMFKHIKRITYTFDSILDKEKIKGVVDVKSVVLRYTLATFGNCIFGIDSKTLEKDRHNNPFLHVATTMFYNTKKRAMKIIGRSVYPNLFYGLGLKNLPAAIDNFFQNYLKDLFTENGSISSRGFTELLNKMKTERKLIGDAFENIKGHNNKAKLDVDDDMLLGQCMSLFTGGFDSSATIVAYALYEISKRPEIQDRIIQEIDDYLIRYNNELTYDCLTQLPYVNACIEEALRMYPIIGILRREVTESYTLPCGAVLDKGVRIHIPTYHIHHNPKIFLNPEEFTPERFLDGNKEKIIPYTLLSFGEGPRMCVGMRFAKMQMVPAMMTILKRYRVELPKYMPRRLEFVPTSLTTQPTQEITLNFVEREDWQHRKFA